MGAGPVGDQVGRGRNDRSQRSASARSQEMSCAAEYPSQAVGYLGIRAVELRVRALKDRSDKHREETDVTPARRNNGEVSVLLFNKLADGVWPVV